MSKKALIIDDSAYMRDYIKNALTSDGWEIIGEAENGDSGIELALSQEPDLITLDNVLPDMLGVDLARILKVDEGITSKIIMISALRQDRIVEQAKSYGVEGYIAKPFTTDTLIDHINNIQ
ncbi:MAG: response regulator [Bacteroidota bacterium]